MTPTTGDVPRPDETAGGLPERLRRRRRMLAWSAPLLGLALTAGPFLIGIALADDSHRSTAQEDPAAAIDGYAALADDTRFGPRPWIAVYNTGTSAFMADQAATAVTELTEALELVPEGTEGDDGEVDPELPECLVRRNLSLSYESLAAEALADEDRPMVEQHLTDAIEALGPCTTEPIEDEPSESPSESESEEPSSQNPSESPSESESQDGGEDPSQDEPQDGDEDSSQDEPQEGDEEGESGNPNDEIQRRQDESREQNREAQRQEEEGSESSDGEEDPSGGDEGGEGEEETSLSPQEQELQDRNTEAEQDQRQQEQRGGGGYGGGQNW